jgi:hypothetical protein
MASVRGEVIVSTAGEDQKALSFKTPDGGLAPVVGVETVQVFRSSHDTPTPVKVGEGGSAWTYNHHTDMAVWKGKFYLAWTNGQKDEDIWPSHEVYATSDDGSTWSEPKELFPQGVSTSLRMYWFKAPNGRMLVIGGLRTGTEKLEEAKKGGLVVREVLADHNLGPVYTLQEAPDEESRGKTMKPMPAYTTAADKGFVEACGQLLANRTFLEQQDFGVLLGKDKRMNVYEGADRDFGRAFSIFERKDGALVAIGKRGFTTLSKDGGKTWEAPSKAQDLVTGNAKVWAQRTSDGRYAILYNPHTAFRLPLVIQTSDDGITFGPMRLINGESQWQRYVGVNRTPGVQYMRGVSIFANDGSRKDTDLFVAYSANKEDIWVSRVAVPVKLDETAAVDDTFAPGPDPLHVPNWNTYSPLWAPVRVESSPSNKGSALALHDADPYDSAQAQRVFKEAKTVTLTTDITPLVAKGGQLDVELRGPRGDARPVRLTVGEDSVLRATDGTGTKEIATLQKGSRTTLMIAADAAQGTFAVTAAGKRVDGLKFVDPAASLSRVIFRTGPMKPLPIRAQETVRDDKPLTEASTFFIHSLKVE